MPFYLFSSIFFAALFARITVLIYHRTGAFPLPYLQYINAFKNNRYRWNDYMLQTDKQSSVV